MSIASSNQQEVSSHLTGLLAFHAGLADWLATTLRNDKDLATGDLLALFLAECRALGIPETAYPFIAEDQGLADLRAYVQGQKSAEEPGKLDALMPDQDNFSQADSSSEEILADAPTDKMPVLKMAAPRQTSELPPPASDEARMLANAEDITRQETTRIPAVVPLAQEDDAVPAEDVTQQETTRIPVLKSTTKETIMPAEDITRQETMGISVLELAAEEEAYRLTGDVTRQETVHIQAIEGIEQAHKSKREEQSRQEAAPVHEAEVQAGQEAEPVHDAGEQAGQEIAAVHDVGAQASQEAEPVRREKKRKWTAPVRIPGARGRRGGRGFMRRPRTRRQRILAAVMLVLILVPVLVVILFGINAYSTYRGLSDTAHSAVNHLLDAKNIFSTNGKGSASKSHLGEVFTIPNLQRAEQDFSAAGRDFRQFQQQLKRSSTLQLVTAYLPQYSQTLSSARVASQVGIDVSLIGQIAATQAIPIAPTFSGSLLAATGQPLVTPRLLATARTTLDQITPLLADIQAQAQHLSLDSLPISASEKTQVGQMLRLLPQVMSDLGIIHSLLNNAGWLLGVDQPRTFLVQTLDRAELRATGGFTGQYGELTINAGRVAPFSLKDISLVEYTNTSANRGQLAPQQYRSWWPFANWGLRDSNISADFPSAAQLAITLYKQETNRQVDGVITFTPVVIEHVLAITGPIQVPGYNTTVTAQNLEDVLHYYQLNNSGILKQIINQPGNTSTSDRKRFTNYLANLLMEKVRSASPDQLLSIAHQMFADLQSRDLQMYFSDPGAEDMLVKYGYAGALDRSTTHDGWYVVQENLSASKASQFVQTNLQDTVTLDGQGGATHLLHIRLVYNQAGPVYGYDTYYDYLRVYVPPTSRLLAGDGFASGTPLCGGRYGDCPLDGAYPGSELTCPAGQYQPGATPPWLDGSNGGTWQPLQTVGGPTNTTSDENGRAMYGGWVIVPKNCTMNVTLSWYVPPSAGHPYNLLVQRQVGTFPELNLSILPSATACAQLHTAGLYYDGVLNKDASFTLPSAPGQQKCYPLTGT